MTTPLAKRARWSAADFSEWCFGERTDAAVVRARRFMRDLDARHGGKLRGKGWPISVAVLRRHVPELFEEVNCLAWRLDAVEEGIAEIRAQAREVNAQTAQTARDLERLSATRHVAGVS